MLLQTYLYEKFVKCLHNTIIQWNIYNEKRNQNRGQTTTKLTFILRNNFDSIKHFISFSLIYILWWLTSKQPNWHFPSSGPLQMSMMTFNSFLACRCWGKLYEVYYYFIMQTIWIVRVFYNLTNRIRFRFI